MRRRALQQANFCTVSLSLSLSSFFFLVFLDFFLLFFWGKIFYPAFILASHCNATYQLGYFMALSIC